MSELEDLRVEVERLTALVAQARRWIVNCVDSTAVGVDAKREMLAALLAPSPAATTGEAGCTCHERGLCQIHEQETWVPGRIWPRRPAPVSSS